MTLVTSSIRITTFIIGITLLGSGGGIAYCSGVAEAICEAGGFCEYSGYPFFSIITIIGVFLTIPFIYNYLKEESV